MIKITDKTKLVRQTTAPFEFTADNGENVVEDIRVRYYSLTIAEVKAQRDKMEAIAKETPDKIIWSSDTLPDILESLPDIEIDGKPLTAANGNITTENLDKIARTNIEAIDKAIRTDLLPKEPATK